MNEKEVMEYIESLAGCGIRPGLDSIRELCRRLGDPQKSTKWIHIAGTNGKGSVLAYLSTILSCAGYRVGRYLSPTIREYRERFQINGKMIPKKTLGDLMEQVRTACDGMVADGLAQPTPFEVETALAFLYFREKQCDFGVLEVGMGGREDATNVIEGTLIEVITSIGMDHMNFLGKTLPEIAAQKGGIIKPESAVVCMEQSAEVMDVIKKTAREQGARWICSEYHRASKICYGLEKQKFTYDRYGRLEIRLAGKFQIANAALAADVCSVLEEIGYPVGAEAVRRGLRETVWPGRLTILQKHPLFIVDGAHNEDAAEKLAESIEFYFTNRRIIYIMGVLKDKEYDKVIALTAKYAEQIITVTPPGNPRALPAIDLAQEAAKVHPSVTAAASLEEAVEIAQLFAGKDDVILAFGSLSYLGRLMDLLNYEDKASGKKSIRRKHNG
ncbi:MAG: bifunctional folylpolyglutamate synthase/dihydrofolate synthase [Lachnospiraceae bacterium]|nr:bifunctional folylpolyglutamate synthase/dihydrofolate synthase [Lachnospiraceae bacterium]